MKTAKEIAEQIWKATEALDEAFAQARLLFNIDDCDNIIIDGEEFVYPCGELENVDALASAIYDLTDDPIDEIR